MTRDHRDYIEDIVMAIDEIIEFTEGMDGKSFEVDRKTVKAVIRNLEVIGEAAGKIPLQAREKFPNIPWKQLIGMRNKLIHEYFGVDIEMVWTACREEIPALKKSFQELKTEFG